LARVEITIGCREEIIRVFKGRSGDIFQRMKALEENPSMGKPVGYVGTIVIKELKWDSFRFYCIADGHVLKFGSKEELQNLLIKFVTMSDKKTQQKTIDEIKSILLKMGTDGSS
jgi:hypothetical protein